MIKAILWDMDGTLLDFLAAERAALRSCFEKLGLGACTDEMIRRYSAINVRYWQHLERGEMTKPQILVGRFETFFASEGLDAKKAKAFNDEYQIRLGDTVVFCDGSDAILRSLKGKVRQYIVSNGTVIAQTRKLKRSGIGELADGVFLSEEIGYEKPAKAYFDEVFRRIGDLRPQETLIVGDSLTSDIRGGNNAGVPTCWYNPHGKVNDLGVTVDYEIRDLREIYEILRMDGERG